MSSSGWAQNTDDNCTPVTAPSSGSGLTFYPEVALTVRGNHLSATETSATVNATGKLSAGSAGLKFSAPGGNNSGFVDLAFSLSGQPWLQYPWQGIAIGNTNPTARATFGIFRSGSIIYRRENY
jgi:MSHA biogenesis protein MshQ